MLVALAIATGHLWLVGPAAFFAVVGGVFLLRRLGEALLSSVPAGLTPHDPTRAHIGMGASIAEDAVVEPGAVVEMGATVGSGAVVTKGAVVRMGATVGRDAVLEEGACVSWGATVMEEAVLGAGSHLGAGATVSRGAQVPAAMSVSAGVTYAANSKRRERAPRQAAALQESKVDPRDERVDVACERLENELKEAPEQVREHLGTSAETVGALRRTCHDLLRRERALREEANPEALARLDKEKEVIEQRLAAATDPAVRRSLSGAVAAIAEQRRQRELLRTSADRLDAEQTRLILTLEGLGTQLVRLRTAGAELGPSAGAELIQGVQQLHDEIEAIAQALEQVTADEHASTAPAADSHSVFEEATSPAADERKLIQEVAEPPATFEAADPQAVSEPKRVR